MRVKPQKRNFKIYCEKCEEIMTLLSRTITQEFSFKKERIFDVYRCECGKLKAYKKIYRLKR